MKLHFHYSLFPAFLFHVVIDMAVRIAEIK